MVNRKQLIKKYLDFFKSKNHKEIVNSPLIPENDPTVLFTTAGMHPLVPYLLGQKHPLGKKLHNVQKCIRTVDIEEVGNTYHHTFFEMLGNWSIGDYFKKQAIKMSFEFLTKILKIPKEKLAITCFKGDKNAPKDTESESIWIKLGIAKERIAFLPTKDNFWGPAGKTGPCGPCTEMFYWTSSKPTPKKFNPSDKKWVEIWNDVFMEYQKNEKGQYEKLIQKNVDTGMGVERTIAALNKIDDNYLTDSFLPLIEKIEKISKRKYGTNKYETKAMRIIADHIKASVFILAEGIQPNSLEQGYVLRRLIRRAIRYGKKLNIKNFTSKVAEPVFKIYDDYKHLQKNKKQILNELEKEEKRFRQTLASGLRYFNKIVEKTKAKTISCKDAFLLYQSYGFPIEMTIELAKERKLKIDKKGFEKECQKHQKLSRTSTAGRFKSGLADDSEATTKLHTATHLLLSALRKVLQQDIRQKGSNITPERLRFDFNFDRKLTKEELQKIENLVNKKIKASISINCKEMNMQEAKKLGAQAEFKYKEKVNVYSIGNFSKEICAGPHVKNTSELGKFKIKKESSSSAGVRRIKGILE